MTERPILAHTLQYVAKRSQVRDHYKHPRDGVGDFDGKVSPNRRGVAWLLETGLIPLRWTLAIGDGPGAKRRRSQRTDLGTLEPACLDPYASRAACVFVS